MDKQKPGLALIIGHALAQKGKAKHDPMPEDMDGDVEQDDGEHEHLKEIASDLLKAIDDKDPDAIADLLKEAFECCDSGPHKEGPHIE